MSDALKRLRRWGRGYHPSVDLSTWRWSFRAVQEVNASHPEKIRSVGGANRKKCRLEMEEEARNSGEEEEEEEEEEDEPTPEEQIEKVPLEVPKANMPSSPVANTVALPPTTPKQSEPAFKPPSEPAVFIPVDRSAEIQVGVECQIRCLRGEKTVGPSC